MTLTVLVFSESPTPWIEALDELAARISARWPDAVITKPMYRPGLTDLDWKMGPPGCRVLGHRMVRDGTHVLEGCSPVVAEYVAWWRSQVPRSESLILYNESANESMPLHVGVEAATIEAWIG